MLEFLLKDSLWGYSLFFVFGACIGSFLNVCIHRIPDNKSIAFPRSYCPACNQTIAWYYNIPVISWILLRGRCAYCKKPISFQYPIVELITALLFCLSWSMPLWGQKIGGMVFISFLIVGTVIDIKKFILPDAITVNAMFMGLIISFMLPSLHGFVQYDPALLNNIYGIKESLVGVLVGTGALVWIAILSEKVLKKEAMGFGDSLFCGSIGAFLGWKGALFSIFGGAFFSLILIVLLMVLEIIFKIKIIPRASHSSIENDNIKSENISISLGVIIPFGPVLAFGGILYLFYFRDVLSVYL